MLVSVSVLQIFLQNFWWPSFSSYSVVSHFRCQSLPKTIKMAAIALLFNIDTCNINQTSLSLGQTWTWISCQSLLEITKNGCHCSSVQDRDLQWKLNITKFRSMLNLIMLSAILIVSHYQKSWKWFTAQGLILTLHGFNLTPNGLIHVD